MKRYDHHTREFGETGYLYTSDMHASEKGGWVRYEDVAEAVLAAFEAGYMGCYDDVEDYDHDLQERMTYRLREFLAQSP